MTVICDTSISDQLTPAMGFGFALIFLICASFSIEIDAFAEDRV